MTENAVRRGAAGKRPGADDASRRVGGAGERDVAATAGSSDPANDARILIVDDEEAIAGMLDEFFRMEGMRTSVATCGDRALGIAGDADEDDPIDLVLLDVNMPGMDGFEVCRRLREHLACPIIFLTARVEDIDQIDGFAAGADDYVLKPFSLPVLGQRVRAHLAREQRKRVAELGACGTSAASRSITGSARSRCAARVRRVPSPSRGPSSTSSRC